jgi:3-hydroxymyristoyl/3-hydroxydecanoyl-(acyl carrier protein) dehydratase
MGEFQFEPVDSTAGDAVRFRLVVPEKCSFFEGHFDGDPILPGVVQICDIVLDRIEACWPTLGAPLEIPRVKFTLPIRPLAQLELSLDRDPTANTVRFSLTANGIPASAGLLRFGRDAAPEGRSKSVGA